MLKLQRGLQRCGKPCPHLSVCSARSLFVCFLFVFFLSACSTVRGSGTVYFNVIFFLKKKNQTGKTSFVICMRSCFDPASGMMVQDVLPSLRQPPGVQWKLIRLFIHTFDSLKITN